MSALCVVPCAPGRCVGRSPTLIAARSGGHRCRRFFVARAQAPPSTAVADPPASSASPDPRTAAAARPPPQPAPPSSSPAASPSPAPSPAPAPYAWARNWVPVAPLSMLDPTRPMPATLLGQSLVVWHHASLGWRVMEDRCPHRLAPLSEGRLEGGGTRLACAYHGWEFDQAGACTKVPQLAADPRAAATACASPRSCVTSYPTAVVEGVLLAWMDGSKEGLAAAAATPPPRMLGEGVTALGDWLMNELPNDYRFWVEQGMDPAHAPFLHHGLGAFRYQAAVQMEGERVREVDLAKGWRWEHRGYEQKNRDMRAVREFEPPFIVRATYDMPSGSRTNICTLNVPVRPGVSRTYFKFGLSKTPAASPAAHTAASQPPTPAGASAPLAEAGAAAPAVPPKSEAMNVSGSGGGGLLSLLSKVVGKVPHWVVGGQLLADQDVIMMCRQEVLMRRQGLGRRDYNLNSPSDEGVSAINRWLDLAGYPDSLWGPGSGTSSSSSSRSSSSKVDAVSGQGVQHEQRQKAPAAGQTYESWPERELSLEAMLSRQQRHVQHCAVCRKGVEQVTAACVAATAAAAALAGLAAVMCMAAALSPRGLAAVGGWGPLAAAAVAAVVLAAAAVQGWLFREDRFVSGVRTWRRIGGYSVRGLKK